MSDKQEKQAKQAKKEWTKDEWVSFYFSSEVYTNNTLVILVGLSHPPHTLYHNALDMTWHHLISTLLIHSDHPASLSTHSSYYPIVPLKASQHNTTQQDMTIPPTPLLRTSIQLNPTQLQPI